MTDSANYLSQLHKLLNQHFNLAEIRTLCLDLNVDYESVAGEEKPSRIRELLLGLGRNGRLAELVSTVQQQRLLIEWPPVPNNFDMPETLYFIETDKTAQKKQTISHQINTSGGAYIGGDVNTGGGEFTGRDKITYGDKSEDDKVAAAFISIQTAVDHTNLNDAQKLIAKTAVDKLRAEAIRGQDADANLIEQWLGMLVQLGPDIAKVAIDTLHIPIQDVSTVFVEAAQKARVQMQSE